MSLKVSGKLFVALVCIMVAAVCLPSAMTSTLDAVRISSTSDIILPMDSYIRVSPSSAKPGQTMTIRGYKFKQTQKLLIYLDSTADEYHKLGEVNCTAGGFTYAFIMGSNFVGEHIVYAVLADYPSFKYSARFKLKSTDSIDDRLFRYIWEFRESILNILEGWFGSGGKYSKTTQMISGTGEIHFTNEYRSENIFIPPYLDKVYKITITIRTINIWQGEGLTFTYWVSPLMYDGEPITIDNDASVTLVRCAYARPYENFFWLWSLGLEPDFYVYYSYVVEFEP